MTSNFRQAFLNSSGGGQSSFGGGFSRAPSIPSGEIFTGHSPILAHVPMPLSMPTVETTSLRVGVDYQGNQFINRQRLVEHINAATGNSNTMTQDNVDEIIMGIENYISEEQKGNEKSVRFNTKQLPKETNWRDIHIYILNFAITNPKRTKVIVTIPGTDFELQTDMEDIGLYDRKRGLISSEGVLLGFLSTGKLFSWSEGGMAPDSFRTAKFRLAAVLEKYFGLEGSPIILQGNRYDLAFGISCGNQVKTVFEGQSITNLYP